MGVLLDKARDILPGHNSPRSDSRGDRSIPPEPVQQQPHGDFREQEKGPALQTLNLARANKRCAGLTWDSQLADDAQQWADERASRGANDVAALGTTKSQIQEQGEAVFVHELAGKATVAVEPSYEDAIKTWLAQETKYTGGPIPSGDEEAIKDWRDYAQVMWQNTKHIGMGKAKTTQGTWLVVARFTPQGNVAGEMPF